MTGTNTMKRNHSRLGDTVVVRAPEVVDERPDDNEDPQDTRGRKENAPKHREQRVVICQHQDTPWLSR